MTKLKIAERIFIIAAVILTSTVLVRATDRIFFADGRDEEEVCGKGMAYVPSSQGGFCIDKYEASAGTNCPYTEPADQRQSLTNLDYKECRPDASPDKLPWTYISQSQAAAACAKAGKRLATNKEWTLASLGTPDKNGDWTIDDCHVNKNWGKEPGSTGTAPGCVSSSGAYDLIGNVWEWTSETVADGIYQDRALPEKGYVTAADENGMPVATDIRPDDNYYYDHFWIKSGSVRGIARGGYWDNAEGGGQYAVYAEVEPSFAGHGVGFRCVKDIR